MGIDDQLQAGLRAWTRLWPERSAAAGVGRAQRRADFRGEKRSNATHASDAKLYRKGSGMEARLAFLGHALIDNRSGHIIDACLTKVSGDAELVAAPTIIEPHAERPRLITLGADRAYAAAGFVNELRSIKVPHVAQNLTCCGARHGRPHYPPSRLCREHERALLHLRLLSTKSSSSRGRFRGQRRSIRHMTSGQTTFSNCSYAVMKK